MQVEVVYRNGQLHLTRPIKLKHEGIKLTVNVPDEEVEAPETSPSISKLVMQRAQNLRQRLDRVLDGDMPDHESLPPLSDETLERTEAFSFREDR